MSNLGNKFRKSLLSLLVLGISATTIASCARPTVLNTANLGEVKTQALMVVPNSNRIDVLDMQTNRVVQTLKTDSTPTSIAASPDGRMILVTNSNSGTVSVFLRRDNEDFQELNSVGSGSRPIGVAFNPNAQFSEAYVAYEGSKAGEGKVLILDTRDRNASPKIIRTIPIPDSAPRKVVVSDNGNRVYITDGLTPRVLTLTRTGSSNFTLNKSQPFDTNPANVSLDGLIVDAQDRLFIANNARSDVFVFNGQSGTVVQDIALQDNQIVGQNQVGPRNLVLYKNPATGASKIYVTGHNASVVSVIDPTGLRLLKNIPLYQNTQGKDSYNPVGIGVGKLASTEDVIYVTNTSGLTISIIDPATDTLRRNTSTTASAGDQEPLGEMVTVGAVK
jgi:DNA-binding beta-propeller fold protein YncE